MEAVAAQSALLDRVRHLEEEKAKLEAWEAEKQRYELANPERGFYAYILKPGMENGEPMTWHLYKLLPARLQIDPPKQRPYNST
jgi:hypothetical protein